MTAGRLSPQQQAWVEHALPRVEQMARALAPKIPHASHDELRSAGYEGLVQAALRYDPASGVPFIGFAYYRVRGAMIDAARRSGPAWRRRARAVRALQTQQALLERAAAAQPPANAPDPRTLRERVAAASDLVKQMTLSIIVQRLGPEDPDLHADDRSGNAEEILLDQEQRHAFDHVLDSLLPDERALIEALYFDGVTMHEYAARTGRSTSTISRQHARVIARLTVRMRARMDEP